MHRPGITSALITEAAIIMGGSVCRFRRQMPASKVTSTMSFLSQTRSSPRPPDAHGALRWLCR